MWTQLYKKTFIHTQDFSFYRTGYRTSFSQLSHVDYDIVAARLFFYNLISLLNNLFYIGALPSFHIIILWC